MNTPATGAPELRRFVRIKWETRGLVSFLEGVAAAASVAVMLKILDNADDPIVHRLTGSAFATGGVSAFLLWPMAIRHRRFSYYLAALFGVMVVLLASYLWSLTLHVLIPSAYPSGAGLPWTFWRVIQTLAVHLELVIAGTLVIGWLTFPLGIGMGCAAAAWGNSRLRRARTDPEPAGLAGPNG